jgi:hypothetical protein
VEIAICNCPRTKTKIVATEGSKENSVTEKTKVTNMSKNIPSQLVSVCSGCGHNECFHALTVVQFGDKKSFCMSPQCFCENATYVRQIQVPSFNGIWFNTLTELGAYDLWLFGWDKFNKARYISTFREEKTIRCFYPENGPKITLGDYLSGFKVLSIFRCNNGESLIMMREPVDVKPETRTIKLKDLKSELMV